MKIGHHFVPQRYLRNFEIPGRQGFVWLYDKQSGESREASIAKVAQERQFYDAQDERLLGEVIEKPGNRAITELLSNSNLADSQLQNLIDYVGTMLMRVPERRNRVHRLMPRVVAQTRGSVMRQVSEFVNAHVVDSVDAGQIVSRLEQYIDSFENELPAPLIEHIRAPWASRAILQAIQAMTFRALVAPGPSFFATSDNPVFFFPCYGLGEEHSELRSHSLQRISCTVVVSAREQN